MHKKNLFKEPLLHFLLIGAALFLLFSWKGKPAPVTGMPGGGAPAAQIVISRDAVAQINEQFARTWQREPTEVEEKNLVEDLVRNEIYYREAIAIGLDRDDEALKRRMRQKMEFIYEDISAWAEPSDADLSAFLKKNREKYATDPQLSFRQVFINANIRGRNADPDARQALAQLAAGSDPDAVSDPTMLVPEVSRQPLREINLQFGEEFGKALLELKPGAWAGPIRSGYGLHLVFMTERRDGRLPELKEVRESVKRDWLVEKQKELKDAAYAKLRERYAVVVEKPKPADTSLTAAATPKVKN